MATSKKARGHARSLAREVYKDRALRPAIDEDSAQVLAGGPVPKGRADLEGTSSLVRAIGTTSDTEVQRRLAGSLGRDLHARLVILVDLHRGEPTARVIRMPEEKVLAVKLTATKSSKPKGGWSWREATSMLKELSIGAPPPGPRKKPAGGTGAPAPEDEDDDDGNLLTSPWFWGGLGLVVTVGATVLILSQTTLNEPDTVMVTGRVVP